jgi:hypothetical protein
MRGAGPAAAGFAAVAAEDAGPWADAGMTTAAAKVATANTMVTMVAIARRVISLPS